VFWVASFSDKTEAKRLFQQLSPGGYEKIMEAYRHATVGRGPGSALGLSHAYSDLATID